MITQMITTMDIASHHPKGMRCNTDVEYSWVGNKILKKCKGITGSIFNLHSL